MPSLELASAEELLRELVTRYTALVVVGVHRESVDEITTVVVGPGYMCRGLVEQLSDDLATSVEFPEE
jgi:hypothetical protein